MKFCIQIPLSYNSNLQSLLIWNVELLFLDGDISEESMVCSFIGLIHSRIGFVPLQLHRVLLCQNVVFIFRFVN
nr:hypothetical protein Itr_chr03CG10120 [Ipomoea trifida]GMC86838.1 hypothetical protein Iba_chr04dCG14560 [Ipomoea batatas]